MKKSKKKKTVAKRKFIKRPKRPKKKPERKKTSPAVTAKGKKLILELQPIGEVTHYFPKVKAAVIEVSNGELNVGDTLYIKGHTTDFKQRITSMQINHVPIKRAKKGDEIGLLVKARVRSGDSVYKI